MSEEKLALMGEDKNIKYCCDVCNGNSTINELRQMLKICLDKMKEQSDIINKQMEFISGKMMDTDVIKRKEKNRKKYSEVLLIKPVNEQGCNSTRAELLDNIDPGKLKVGVEEVRNIKDGGLVIECNDNKSKQIITAEVKERFGEKYEIVEAKQRMPMLVIKGVEGKYVESEDDEIMTKLIDQNELRSVDDNIENKMKIEKKFLIKRKRNCCNIVISLESSIYGKIKERPRLNLGWRKCNVGDYFNILRCFKCGGYNHFAENCRNKTSCFKCSAEHSTKECTSTERKCTNCIHKNQKLGINLDVDHTALDSNCPCYKRIVDSICKKTAYGQS